MATPCCQKQVIKLFKRDRKDKGDNDLRRNLKNEVVATMLLSKLGVGQHFENLVLWSEEACQVRQGEGSYGVVYGMQRCQCFKCTRSPRDKLEPKKYFENAMVTCHVGVSMQRCLDAFPNCAEFASVTDFQHVLFSVFVTCQAMVASNFRHNDLTARNVCVQLGVPETVRVGDHAFELRHKVRLIDCGLADTDYNPEYDPFSENEFQHIKHTLVLDPTLPLQLFRIFKEGNNDALWVMFYPQLAQMKYMDFLQFVVWQSQRLSLRLGRLKADAKATTETQEVHMLKQQIRQVTSVLVVTQNCLKFVLKLKDWCGCREDMAAHRESLAQILEIQLDGPKAVYTRNLQVALNRLQHCDFEEEIFLHTAHLERQRKKQRTRL